MALVAFYVLGILLLASAVAVVASRNLIHSAVFLVLAFLSLAGLYLTLEAEFIAAVQVLVYAGGIMVLFLFAVMLVSFRGTQNIPHTHPYMAESVFLGALFFSAMGWLVWGAVFKSPAPGGAPALAAEGGNVATVAMTLFRNYLFPFELASLFLLAAMIGAILLAKKDI
ncbi:MAG: NADH-quinone oxidoreductase subunit J [Acidobacteriota bacterium]|nr:MAG: NADH-quinone oxidoreductase subunit J [Acidobacteriota bacterium]